MKKINLFISKMIATKTILVIILSLLLSCAPGKGMLVRIEAGPTELPPRAIQLNKNSYIVYLSSKKRDEKKALYLDLNLLVSSNLNTKTGANTVKNLPLSSKQYYYFELDIGDGKIYKPLGSMSNIPKIVGPDSANIKMSFKLPKGSTLASVKIHYIADETFRKKATTELEWFDISEYVKQEDSLREDPNRKALNKK